MLRIVITFDIPRTGEFLPREPGEELPASGGRFLREEHRVAVRGEPGHPSACRQDRYDQRPDQEGLAVPRQQFNDE